MIFSEPDNEARHFRNFEHSQIYAEPFNSTYDKTSEITLNGNSLFPPQKFVNAATLQLRTTKSKTARSQIATIPSFIKTGYQTII
jgi:hypothetical protein